MKISGEITEIGKKIIREDWKSQKLVVWKSLTNIQQY